MLWCVFFSWLYVIFSAIPAIRAFLILTFVLVSISTALIQFPEYEENYYTRKWAPKTNRVFQSWFRDFIWVNIKIYWRVFEAFSSQKYMNRRYKWFPHKLKCFFLGVLLLDIFPICLGKKALGCSLKKMQHNERVYCYVIWLLMFYSKSLPWFAVLMMSRKNECLLIDECSESNAKIRNTISIY